MQHACNLAGALAGLSAYWSPRVVGQVNDQFIKVAKGKGEVVWHDHADEDEMFMVMYGRLTIRLEHGEVLLGPGECYVVPKGTLHQPYAEEECGFMLIETVTTRHTGDRMTAQTVAIEAQL